MTMISPPARTTDRHRTTERREKREGRGIMGIHSDIKKDPLIHFCPPPVEEAHKRNNILLRACNI